MNRPTDKQIEEVLAGVATPEDAKFVAEWFATEEGCCDDSGGGMFKCRNGRNICGPYYTFRKDVPPNPKEHIT